MIPSEYDAFIRDAAEKYAKGVDWRRFKAQFYQESLLDPDAISPAGARGIAQFMPATWSEWSRVIGYREDDIHDPLASIYVGVLYMNYLLGQWSSPRPEIDRHCLALASYNAGLGNILKAQKKQGGKLMYHEIIKGLNAVTGHNSAETVGYVAKILGYYNRLILSGL